LNLRDVTLDLLRLVDIRPGEIRRVGYMAALLFFMLAANNVIKVVRDSLFLSRFPISQLPYVYLLAALVAGVVIAIYSRYTAKLPLARVLPGSLAFIISNLILFWILISFYSAGWVLYAYYMWSAIVGLILVAQFWTVANEMFTPRDGKRLFGLITAGGTLGGMVGGVVSTLAVGYLVGTKQLLWFVVVLLAGAFAVAYCALKERERLAATNRQGRNTLPREPQDPTGVIMTLARSRYLQTIAAVVFVSVIVSTLIDYQFKATAKLSYPSADALAGFFGAYYGWLSVLTIAAQIALTGKLLTSFGLTQSLLVLPVTLFATSVGLVAWPGLVTATASRITEAALRTSVYQSSVQILYLPITEAVKKKVKVFMDVTMERLGDGVAALIILLSLTQGGTGMAPLGYFAIVLIVIWIALIFAAKAGYVDALRRSLFYRDLSLDAVRLDFRDQATVETVLKIFDRPDEKSVLLGLELLEQMVPQALTPRLPRSLLRHDSAEVRRRALKLMARSPAPELLNDVLGLLASGGTQVQTEAINTLSTLREKDAVPVIKPFLQSSEPEVRRAAIHGLLRYGDADNRQAALGALDRLVAEGGPDGEKCRVQAARLMGDVGEPTFSARLATLIVEDPSPAVIREAMAAAARRRYIEAIPLLIDRLSCADTKAAAREALIHYGEMAIKGLRTSLFDNRVARDVRLKVPRTLSKINAQSAMNALLGGLLEEDRSIRFQVILAIEEMARHFTNLTVDREIVETAIISDALLYSKRFVVFYGLFGAPSDDHADSLLYFALTDSMERIKERVMWLLELIHRAKDIRRAWSGLNSTDPSQRAHAVEFLDNLLIGSMKKYAFTLYCDHRPDQRLRTAMDLAGLGSVDAEAALWLLLDQEDVWLKTAAIWEIGRRGLGEFRETIARFTNSNDALVGETAKIVSARI
jgi:AAA family ATP:ADP antiporter